MHHAYYHVIDMMRDRNLEPFPMIISYYHGYYHGLTWNFESHIECSLKIQIVMIMSGRMLACFWKMLIVFLDMFRAVILHVKWFAVPSFSMFSTCVCFLPKYLHVGYIHLVTPLIICWHTSISVGCIHSNILMTEIVFNDSFSKELCCILKVFPQN